MAATCIGIMKRPTIRSAVQFEMYKKFENVRFLIRNTKIRMLTLFRITENIESTIRENTWITSNVSSCNDDVMF